MRSIANQAYETTKVGGQGMMRPDATLDESLQSFQNDVIDAENMETAGKIHILETHRESQTSLRLVDYIRFTRII